MNWTFKHISGSFLYVFGWIFFSRLLKVSPVVLVFKNVGKRDLWLKPTALLVFLLLLVERCKKLDRWFSREIRSFFWFLVWFQVSSINCWSSDSCIWYRIARPFNRSGAIRAIALDMSQVWHASVLHKLKCNGISGRVLVSFPCFTDTLD